MPGYSNAFISYQTADKATAGTIKSILAPIGISAFLAHEDIEVSEQWRNKILKEIGKSDIFICLLSKNYLESDWCLQESGIAAFRKSTLIIPLSLDHTNPPGFLGHVQSGQISAADITMRDIAPSSIKVNLVKGVETLIKIIGFAKNYRDAKWFFKILVPHLNELSPEQGARLLETCEKNDQVCNAAKCAREYIPRAISLFASHAGVDTVNSLKATCRRYGVDFTE